MYAKNAWEKYDDNELKNVFNFAESYKDFISKGKTERACVKLTEEILNKNGFKKFDGAPLKANDKIYFINKDKNIAAYIIGSEPLTKGLRVLGAHIDSPRLDLKQNPLYESNGFALLDTHYYGGIKKYQWVTIPLSLYGVIYKKDNTKVEVIIGEDINDPVVGISDILVHLAQNQMEKNAAKVIEGEDLDITVGSIPLKGNEKNGVKEYILKILKEKYDINEEDFLSAEIEVVPSGAARDYGLDKSMIAGYGHDDRSCAFTSLMALTRINTPKYTSCVILVDKEEVGSIGATGAQSKFFENTVLEILNTNNDATIFNLNKTMENTKMISSDVSAAFDPLYPSVTEAKNSAYFGNGIVLNKYTGSRGKNGCNDASPEYIAWLRKLFDENKINFQTAELGKVDQGGGGTIAYILGNYNMDVIDAGIPVLNMHSPMEIVSKADIYEAYLAYTEFLKAE